MRTACLVCGALALAIAWGGPLPRMAGGSFAAHMTLHMAVVALAAPLVALGISGTRRDPVANFPGLLAPIPASVVELFIVWIWHAPAPHHFARYSASGFVVEQLSFLVAGVWLWLGAFGGRPTVETTSELIERRGAGVLGLLLTSMHMTLLGALLALSPRLLFAHPHGHGGLSPLADQHLGGAIMLVAGGIAYLAGGLWLMADLMRMKQSLHPTDAS